MGLEGERLIPMLTFAADETVEELVIPEEPGSWMHEYAIGTAEEISDGIWKARSPE